MLSVHCKHAAIDTLYDVTPLTLRRRVKDLTFIF